MNRKTQEKASNFMTGKMNNKVTRVIAFCLSGIVAVGTTINLVVPAHTLEKSCTLQEHTHQESCYSQVTAESVEYISCGAQADVIVHQHRDICFDESGMLRCALEEKEIHIHDETCIAPAHQHGDDCFWEVPGSLICQEITEHVHEDGCYEQNRELICGQDEEPDEEAQLVCAEEHEHTEACWSTAHAGHKHTETCYAVVRGSLICKEHVHTDACYEVDRDLICMEEEREEPALVCGKEELELHTHEADCYDAEGSLICVRAQVVEHFHSQDCVATVEQAVDTEKLTCTVTDEAHEHGMLCYGTWVLDCDLPEHTHTEACGIIELPTEPNKTTTETTQATAAAELTEEEQVRVDAVIAQIDALPTADAIDAQAAAFEDVENYEGLEAYLTGIYTRVADAYKAYTQLSEAERACVTNWDKLAELEYIWSRTTLEEPVDEGKQDPYRELLGEDWAYISNLSISKYATGTEPFDNTDAPGDDSGADNMVLRTFDTAVFTVKFDTALRNAAMNKGVSGYMSARVHFEFILPVSSTKAVFAVESMGWLRAYKGAYYSHDEIDGMQVIRGSFLMEPAADAKSAIPGSQTLDVVIRALRMCNGETLQPTVTMWLAYNDVIKEGEWLTGKEGLVHNCIVTGSTDRKCDVTDEANKEDSTQSGGPHDVEFKTVEAAPIVISAEPRYNVTIEDNPAHVSSGRGVYDFGTGGASAPHKQEGEYKLDGRMYGFGITVEMVGGFTENGEYKGLRGIAFPDEGKQMRIDIFLRASAKGDNESTYHPLPNEFQAWTWSVGENSATITNQEAERDPHVSCTYSYLTPINRLPEGDNNYRAHCVNGGDWKFRVIPAGEVKGENNEVIKGELVQIGINNFQVDLSRVPWGYPQEITNKYYDPAVVKDDYWLIKTAVISSGELWVFVPYESHDGNKTSLIDQYEGGSTILEASIDGVQIYHESLDGPVNSGNMDNVDTSYANDVAAYADPFQKPGTMDTIIRYTAVGDPYFPLVEGCVDNQLDWALSAPYYDEGGKGPDETPAYGQQISMVTEFKANGAEGLSRPIGYDILMKFDDRFFYPTGLDGIFGADIGTVLWAARHDQNGWNHGSFAPGDLGYDTEMMKATPADLIYFTSLQDLRDKGYVCVGVLAQKRDIFPSTSNAILGITGRVQPTAQPGHAYMIAFSSRAWTMEDVKVQTRAYHNLPEDATPSDEQFKEYAVNCLPNWAEQVGTVGIEYKNYPVASYIESYDYTSGMTNTAENGHKNSEKAGYNDDGGIDLGSGAVFFIDSCFLHSYVTKIDKTTAQTYMVNGETHYKTEYELGLRQYEVVYMLYPSAIRAGSYGGSTGGATMKTDVRIEDTIPEGMILSTGSFYWSGQNGTMSYDQNTGVVTGGLQVDEKDSNGAYMTVSIEDDGVVITLHDVTVTSEKETDFGQILYRCQIGKHVPGGTEMVNTATISSTQDKRPFTGENQNIANWSIKVLRMEALSFNKNCLTPIAQWWDDIDFEMSTSNASSLPMENVIVMDNLPFNGHNGSVFHGRMVVSDFRVEMQGELKSLDGLAFYYTTDTSYVNKRASDVTVEEITTGWTKLTVEDGKLNLPSEHELNGYYDGTQTPVQITAIAVVGTIPADHTLNMDATLRLPEGQAEDVLYNYLSQNGQQTVYDTAEVVTRNLSGLAWYDENKDGIRQNEEELLNDVQVSLVREIADGVYEPVCYAGTTDPIVIQTGQSVSMQKQGSVEAYKMGEYLFKDLPEGKYAVIFGTVEGCQLTLKDKGSNDTLDSDADRYYKDNRCAGYIVNDIDYFPSTDRMVELTYVSVHHDAGFCDSYEMPVTGGMGATIYYILGAVMAVPALAGLRRRKKH